MVATRRFLVAGALFLIASVTGAGADYYRGVKDLPTVAMQPASWYVRGDFTYSWMDAEELFAATAPFTSRSIDSTWGLGGGIGTYFGRGVRGDVTVDWRAQTDVHGRGGITTDFSLESAVILANLYYDFRPYERFTPYIGIGLGAAHHRTGSGVVLATCGGLPCAYDGGSNWTPAGALMAGFSFRVDGGHRAPVSIKDVPVEQPGRLHIDVGYRFLYLGDADTGGVVGVVNPTPGPRLEDITAHEVRVGLRWDIR